MISRDGTCPNPDCRANTDSIDKGTVNLGGKPINYNECMECGQQFFVETYKQARRRYLEDSDFAYDRWKDEKAMRDHEDDWCDSNRLERRRVKT